jgi:hypothetical protein
MGGETVMAYFSCAKCGRFQEGSERLLCREKICPIRGEAGRKRRRGLYGILFVLALVVGYFVVVGSSISPPGLNYTQR